VLENAWLRPRYAGFEELQVDALEIVSEFLRNQKSSDKTLSSLDELYLTAVSNHQE
jgi:hypothetical protein